MILWCKLQCFPSQFQILPQTDEDYEAAKTPWTRSKKLLSGVAIPAYTRCTAQSTTTNPLAGITHDGQ